MFSTLLLRFKTLLHLAYDWFPLFSHIELLPSFSQKTDIRTMTVDNDGDRRPNNAPVSG